MNKNIKTYEELVGFLEELYAGGNIVEVIKQKDGTFQVQWVKSKTYIAYDGKEYPDEAWVTEDGRMMLIQDLTEDHAKNIIRMIVRQDKALYASVEEIANRLTEAFSQGGMEGLLDAEPVLSEEDKPPKGSYLH